MNDDLLILVSKLKKVKNLEELDKVKELGESFLRKEKRLALLTLLSISEEIGDDEILQSIKELSSYLETFVKQKKKK